MDRAFPRLPLALGVALVLAGAALAACSGSSGTGTTPPTTSATATPTPAVTATPTPVPTPTPSPVISSTSSYYSPATGASPAALQFISGSTQTAVVTVSEPGYSGTFTVAAGTQVTGTTCTGKILSSVSPMTGATSFTFTTSASATACGIQTFTFADSNLSESAPLTVSLTAPTNVGVQAKHRKKH